MASRPITDHHRPETVKDDSSFMAQPVKPKYNLRQLDERAQLERVIAVVIANSPSNTTADA
ncbi:MAG: hypothetical protein JWO01_580 [Microbacteriaceae bacterium]|nr:hypothetical protein [Microbacteriaceae bacterium]